MNTDSMVLIEKADLTELIYIVTDLKSKMANIPNLRSQNEILGTRKVLKILKIGKTKLDIMIGEGLIRTTADGRITTEFIDEYLKNGLNKENSEYSRQ